MGISVNGRIRKPTGQISVRRHLPPQWATAAGNLGIADEGTPVNATLAASGRGAAIQHYRVVAGTLPPGLALNPATGQLAGTVADIGTSTTYSFTVEARDTLGGVTLRTFSFDVTSFSMVPQYVTWVTNPTFTTNGYQVTSTLASWNSIVSTKVNSPTKHYWEFYINATGNYTGLNFEPMTSDSRSFTWIYDSGVSGNFQSWINGTPTNTSNRGLFNTGDRVMFACDYTARKLWVGRNGTWSFSGNPATGANPVYTWPAAGTGCRVYAIISNAGRSVTLNAGQNPWFNPAWVPAGFIGLYNLVRQNN